MSHMLEQVMGRGTVRAWWIGALVTTAAGVTLGTTAPQLPGAEPVSVEDAVDAVAMVALGGLGVVLVRRGVAAGLGRCLVLMAALTGLIWLSGGLADVIADGATPPLAAQLLKLASSVLFIPAVVLLYEGPLLLFPTGRLPSPRWRWIAGTAVAATAASVVSMLLAPGLLDEDVPSWGDNPLGIGALDRVTSVIEAAGLVLVLVTLLASVVAVVVRSVRHRGARRRQMWWFIGGASPMVVGMLADAGSSAAAQVGQAVVIFGGLLAGMAWALLGPPGRAVAARADGLAGEPAPAVPSLT